MEFKLTTLVVIGTDSTDSCSCKSNYHILVIKTTMAPVLMKLKKNWLKYSIQSKRYRSKYLLCLKKVNINMLTGTKLN